jgi:hypothetical protein
MNQRVIQTADFWKNQFQITDEVFDTLYSFIKETGEPQSIDAIGFFFVQYGIGEHERKIRSELTQGSMYLPSQDYAVDDQIIFPHMGFAVGKVVATRPGYNPIDEDFTVLEVVFEDQGELRASFAANLQTSHALLITSTDNDTTGAGTSIQKIYGQFQHIIRPKIEEALRSHDDYIEFNQTWYLKELLIEVQEGLLNIVDAAIDINNGPLNVDALIEHIDLEGSGHITEALRFSVSYCLQQDERFENVGTEENIQWYLNRLKPEYVKRPPRRLQTSEQPFDIQLLDSEQRALLAEIDDETTPVENAKPFDPGAASATFVVNYHHRRLGTLPVLPSVRHLLPQADGRTVALQLIDGRTGDTMLCWYVSRYKYILGLAEWYVKYQLPVGVVLTLTKTEIPTQLVIDFIPQRVQHEYVRVAIARDSRLIFEEKRRRLTCRYDQLMIIGEEGSEKIDALWDKAEKEDWSVPFILKQIMPELVRLSSQGAVHIKTIYSAVNVLKRCSPGLLMQELIGEESMVSMGHGYWTYRPAK